MADPIPASSAAYTVIEARTFRASALTRGPWDPNHQHAGPSIALICRAVEQAAHEHDLTHIARLTANLLRPVPIGELIVEVMTDYVGRNAGHFSAHLMAGNKDVARFTALAQRESPVELPAELPDHPLPMAPLDSEARRRQTIRSQASRSAMPIWSRRVSARERSKTTPAGSDFACAIHCWRARRPASISGSRSPRTPATASVPCSTTSATAS